MKFDFLKENILNLRVQRNGLGFLAGILLLNNMVLSGAVFYKRERTILVPPRITKQLWVQGDRVSKEYLHEMGAYVAKLFLDLSPSTVSYNHGTLLSYATPEAYGSLKKQFLKESEEYTRLQLSTHFKPSEILASPETLEVTIKGSMSSYVAGKHIRDSQETVAIQFTHRDAGMLLEKVNGGLGSDQETDIRNQK
jgi:conjugal transfer pilus assembly protein TraE